MHYKSDNICCCGTWHWSTWGWSYSFAHEAVFLVQLNNTGLEWFIVKYHNAICSCYTNIHMVLFSCCFVVEISLLVELNDLLPIFFRVTSLALGQLYGCHYTQWSFTPSFRLSVGPTCHVRSVAHCLFNGLYSYVAKIQPMKGQYVVFTGQ